LLSLGRCRVDEAARRGAGPFGASDSWVYIGVNAALCVFGVRGAGGSCLHRFWVDQKPGFDRSQFRAGGSVVLGGMS
jgi:hypothetical protein